MHVTVPASLASAIAGKGWRVSLKRPRSSPTRWLACVALPPLPKAMTLRPSFKDSTSARATSSAAARRLSALRPTTSLFASKCDAMRPVSMFAPFPLLASAAQLPARLVYLVGEHREEYDRAERDSLNVRVNAREVQAVVQHADEDRAPKGRDDAAAPAAQRRAADDDRRDNVQLVLVPRVRHARAEARREHESREPDEQPVQNVHEHRHALDAHAREERRLAVAAHGVDVAPERHAPKDEPARGEDQNHEYDGHRHAQHYLSAEE